MNMKYQPILAMTMAGVMATASIPLQANFAAAQSSQFSDIEFNYWARPFIEKLAERKVIAGFPDGSYKPNEPVTRAQFAAILRQAFDQGRVRQYQGFNDVPSKFWGATAIQEAYETGFMSGYANGSFQPNQQIPKVQAVVSLASGLELKANNQDIVSSLSRYRDAGEIPNYARSGVAAATLNNIVVNYPNLNYLNPNQVTTRADVAALVYQALVDQGELEPLASNLNANRYVVTRNTTPGTTATEPPSQTTRVVVQPGTIIKVAAPNLESIRYAIVPSEIYETNLVVAEDIARNNQVLIPKGSLIRGAFRPIQVQAGSTTNTATRYVAQSVTIGNRVYPIQASSSLHLPKGQNELKAEDINTEIRPSDAARFALRALLPSLGTVLFGNAPVVQPTSTGETSVIIIDPDQDLELTLQSGFRVDT